MQKYYPHKQGTVLNNEPEVTNIGTPTKVSIITLSDEQVPVSENVLKVLSLAPSYAVTTKINRKSLDEIDTKFTEAAYKLKWRELFVDKHGPETLSTHLRRQCPFQKTLVKYPSSCQRGD